MNSELKEILDALEEIGIGLPPGIESFRELRIALLAHGPVVPEAEADRDKDFERSGNSRAQAASERFDVPCDALR